MFQDRRNEISISLDEATNEFQKIRTSIKNLLYKLGYECENIRYNHDDLDEAFMKNQYYQLADKLDDIERRLDYLSKPVRDQGYIRQNNAGRYELPSGDYLTSGSVCEILINEESEQYWVLTSIEHNGDDYYSTTLGKDVSIDGMMVRIR